MTLLSVPLVAGSLVRLLQAGPGPSVPEAVRFDEIGAEARLVTVRTRQGPVPCTVYHPALRPVAGAPVYVNFHGGGYVLRHPEQDGPLCRYLAAKARVVVVNADYAVAPQDPFPVAVEQAYDLALWAADPARSWDGTRLCVGGQSAGGGLAAAVARLSLERGGPAIGLQVLHYPPLDLVTPGHEKPAASPRALIHPAMAELFDAAYVPDPDRRRNRLASPAWGDNARGIEGIAPALVITCELDRLRAEGLAYARALDRAGALVEHHDVKGADHGYNILGHDRDLVREVYDLITGHVRRTMGVTD